MYLLARLSLRSPGATLLVLGLATAFFVTGVLRVHQDYGAAPLLGDEHPALVAQEALVRTYGGGYPLIIAWECGPGLACESVFDELSLGMAYRLDSQLAGLGFVRNVESPATASVLVPDPSGFAVRRFVSEQGKVASDAAELAPRALDDPFWRRSLVSEDGTVGAAIVVPSDTNSATQERLIDAVTRELEVFEAEGFSFHLAGHPAESVITGVDLAVSTARSIPGLVVVVAVVVFGLLRCWRSVVSTLATVGMAIVWTYGALGWVGWPDDSLLQVLAPLLFVVGVCDAIHVLAAVARENGSAVGHAGVEAALLGAARSVGPACVITTLTTGAAFLSFTTSPLAGLQRFGAVSAFGVMACLVLTFTMLPLMARWLPPSVSGAGPAVTASGKALRRVSGLSRRYARAALFASALVAVGSLSGWALLLEVDVDAERMWGEDNRVVRWIRFVDRRLGNIDSLEIEVTLPGGDALIEPETLSGVERIEAYLGDGPGLAPTNSYRNLLARVNRMLHDDAPEWERVGRDAAANGQLLELVAMGEPELLEAWVSIDRTRLRISAESVSGATRSRGPTLEALRAFLAAELPASWRYSFTGSYAIEHHWTSELLTSQLRSFGVAFALVFALASLFLRSWRLGLAAMVPATLPVVVVLGIMGFAGLHLDIGRIMVAAVVIGIAVDDAIHVLSVYRRRRAEGDAPATAIDTAMERTGPAVLVTSLALALGFLMLANSAWASIARFGILVCIAILGALAATALLLPAAVLALGDPPESPAP